MPNTPNICEKICKCSVVDSRPRLIVITGGPGAGKTAVLEMAKKVLCQHVAILPEAASIVFGGGFWRLSSPSARLAAQKAIYHVQVEMENLVIGERKWHIGLCDRGTIDSLAYWPSDESSFWQMTGAQVKQEYEKYFAVIHLRSPTDLQGYNHKNPLRIETAIQANEIDEKIAKVWAEHPNYEVIGSNENFLTKAQLALQLIIKNIPDCCRENLNFKNNSMFGENQTL